MPAEIDELERKRVQLEIEREALKKESDAASSERLEARRAARSPSCASERDGHEGALAEREGAPSPTCAS